MNVSFKGVMTGFTVTSAKRDERVALWEISQGIQGLLIGVCCWLNHKLGRDLLQFEGRVCAA